MATRAQRKKLAEDGLLETLEDHRKKIIGKKKQVVKEKEKKKELEKKVEEEEEEEEEVEEVKGVVNPFNLLNVGDASKDSEEESEEKEEEEEEEEQEEEEEEKEEEKEEEEEEEERTTKVSKTQKNQRKKKNKQKQSITQTNTTEDNQFDCLLQLYGADPNRPTQLKKKDQQHEKELLRINPTFLNPQNEEKKLFGSKIVNNSRGGRGNIVPRGRGGRGGGGGGGGRGRQNPQAAPSVAPLRKNYFVTAKDSWPPIAKDMEMELIESKNGINYFKYVWSAAYLRVQSSFFQCVASGDPSTLTNLLEYHPYHIDSMLQLCEACKMTNQLDMALDFIERIIYFFENSHHYLFKPFSDTYGRLEYKHPENRSFLIALFRYIQILDRRGCSRTCLEISKFLLNLDPSDPLGVLLQIDTFALRSQEEAFLLDLSFSEQFQATLSMLPNFAFSTPLAKFKLESKGKKAEGLSSTRSVLSSTELLESAIFLFPGLIPPLLSKCGVDQLIVLHKGERINVLHHPFFLDESKYPQVQRLITLYIARNAATWKKPENLDFLKASLMDPNGSTAKVLQDDPMILNCKAMLDELYKDNTTDCYIRHYMISDIGEVIDLLPANLAREGFAIYDSEEVPQSNQPPVAVQNPLALFFQTLLPWATTQHNSTAAGGGGGQ